MAKKTEDLAKVPGQAMAVPDYIQQGVVQGGEHITNEDARIPRLKLAQSMSPEMKRENPNFIDDLRSGDAFNDLTQEVYGDGPIRVTIVRADKPRWLEFAEDRSIVDFNVPAGDPRTQFTTDATGDRVPPIATKFYDYVVLLDGQTPIALSFKNSGIKHAMRLNGLIRMKMVPIYACWYVLTPAAEKNAKGDWYVFAVKQDGFVDKETYERGRAAYELFKTKEVEFSREAGDDNPDDL